MTKQVMWTKPIIEAFIEEGNLNERQAFILKSRAKGYSVTYQADELHLSVDQVNKDIAYLKKLYDVTQLHSSILPPRRRNKKELYEYIEEERKQMLNKKN